MRFSLTTLLLPCVVAQDIALRGRSLQIDPKSVTQKEPCRVDQTAMKKSQYFEDEIVFEKLFSGKPKCGGTVLEIGGFDGMTLSNSWFFEFGLGWKSILIEAFPKNYEMMKQNRPAAINVFGAMCLGQNVEFSVGVHPATGGATNDMSADHLSRFTNRNELGIVSVPCKTIAGVLRENHITNIDVFFLDVEGAELTVLQTIDWAAVRIGAFVVEMNYTDEAKDDAVRAVLKAHGYVRPFSMLKECQKRKKMCVNNEIFVLPEMLSDLAQV